MKIGVVVQARNGSSRYPGKMLHNFLGKTALEWVITRCRAIDADYRVLATSVEKEDDVLAEIAVDKGWHVVRGGIDDVLGRFAKAVRQDDLETVVRLTGDCILTDYRIVNFALSAFREMKPDYLIVTNIIDGFDVEVISGAAICEADKKAKLPSEREHVTPLITKSKSYRKAGVPYTDESYAHIHLSLDYRDDAMVLEDILAELNSEDFSYADVVDLINAKPALIERTRHIVPSEDGTRRAAEGDRKFIQGLKGSPLRLNNSNSLFDKVLTTIPNCSQTFSKSYLQFSVGASPLFAKEGRGCILTDVDDNTYIDYTMGLGPCILGYAYEPVLEAIEHQLRKGSAYTLPHYLEYELAELLTQVIPCAEMVRFGKNGSDVTSAAVRLARAYTGRDYVACCGYHGWQDWYIATTTRNKGIPEAVRKLTLTFDYNNIGSLEKLFDQYSDKIACVIMEPVSLAAPGRHFLDKVKQMAHKNGALLVFDEVVTGFRFAMGGAQEYFGVTPDITCVGKAMANGMPMSAIVGKREFMKLLDEIFFSFTFGGETASIAAALFVIRYMVKNKTIEYIWKQGEMLRDRVMKLIHEKEMGDIVSLTGYPVRTVMDLKGGEAEALAMKTLFQQECAKRGVLFTGSHNMSLPHDNGIIQKTLSVYDEVMDLLKYSIEYGMVEEMIEGRLLQPVFRKV